MYKPSNIAFWQIHVGSTEEATEEKNVVYTGGILEKDISHQIKFKNEACSKWDVNLLYYTWKKENIAVII